MDLLDQVLLAAAVKRADQRRTATRTDPSPARQELLAALEQAPRARAAFDRMPPSHRERWVAYVAQGKRADTRARRIERCIAEVGTPGAADAGYSGSPLPRKLGIRDGSRVAVVNGPEGFAGTLGVPTTADLLTGPFDVIVVFALDGDALEARFEDTVRALRADGGLWVAWPKRASGIPTDLTESVVRALALARGLVDNKVCAIDAVWSGLRCVFRVADRPAERGRRRPVRKESS